MKKRKSTRLFLRSSRSLTCNVWSGIFCIICALVFTILYDYVVKATEDCILSQMNLGERSRMLGYWKDPPVRTELRVFLYNVTNSRQFLSGLSRNLEVKEVGPYVYSSRVKKKVTSGFNSSETFGFTTNVRYTFVPEKSADSYEEPLVLPNLVILSGLMKKEVRLSSDFVKTNIIWPTLTSVEESSTEAFISLSPKEYLWGYEEELACLDTASDDSTKEAWFEEDEKKDYGYRDPKTRKCVFGVFVKKNDTWTKPLSMNPGVSSLLSKCMITGGEVTTRFGKKSSVPYCYDPSCPPAPKPNHYDNFDLLMDFMCRTLRMKRNSTIKYDGLVNAERFIPEIGALNGKDGSIPLPHGVTSLEKCYEDIPFLISYPRFLHGSDWFRSQIDGMNAPVPEDHELYTDLETKWGVPLGMKMRFQLNLALIKDPSFPALANISRSKTVIPLLWAQEGYHSLDRSQILNMYIVLSLPAIIAKGLVVFFLILAVIFFLITKVILLRGKGAARTQRQIPNLCEYKSLPNETTPQTQKVINIDV